MSLPSGYQKQIIEENKKLFSDLVTYYTRIVQFSRLVFSDSLRPHGGSTPGLPVHHKHLEFTQTHVHWVNDGWVISTSVLPFYSCLQSFPASGPFQISQFFTSGGQSIGVSASVSVFPMNMQDWVPLWWTRWISLLSRGLSWVFSNTTVQKHEFLIAQHPLWSNSHIHTWLLEKP